MKAMILAAGFGTRLLPLTKMLPKPCFPILNVPLIARIINSLKNVGVKEIVINLHHLSDKVMQVAQSFNTNEVTVRFSFEDEILGTAGGIKKAQDFLQGDSFILYNGDILSTVDLADAIRFHNEKKGAATMIVKAGEHPAFIGLDSAGEIARFPYGATKDNEFFALKTYFTGIHILEPTLFDYIPPNIFYNINSSVYPDMMADGHKVYGCVTDAYWQDIGTPQDYLNANFYMLKHHPNSLKKYEGATIIEPSVIGDNVLVEAGTVIGPNAVIGDGCIIKGGCNIANSVVLSDSVVKSGAVIKNCIVFGTELLQL